MIIGKLQQLRCSSVWKEVLLQSRMEWQLQRGKASKLRPGKVTDRSSGGRSRRTHVTDYERLKLPSFPFPQACNCGLLALGLGVLILLTDRNTKHTRDSATYQV